MSEQSFEQFNYLMGRTDALVNRLRIEHLPENLQFAIIGQFTELLFKRVLLRVPKEHTGQVKQEIDETDDSLDAFVDALARAVPELNSAVDEEISRGVAQFRLSSDEAVGPPRSVSS